MYERCPSLITCWDFPLGQLESGPSLVGFRTSSWAIVFVSEMKLPGFLTGVSFRLPFILYLLTFLSFISKALLRLVFIKFLFLHGRTSTHSSYWPPAYLSASRLLWVTLQLNDSITFGAYARIELMLLDTTLIPNVSHILIFSEASVNDIKGTWFHF